MDCFTNTVAQTISDAKRRPDAEQEEEVRKKPAAKEAVELRTAMAKRIYSILFEEPERKKVGYGDPWMKGGR
jgi:hypothetical protein